MLNVYIPAFMESGAEDTETVIRMVTDSGCEIITAALNLVIKRIFCIGNLVIISFSLSFN